MRAVTVLSHEPASDLLPVISRSALELLYISSRIVCSFFSQIHVLNKGGVIVYFCVKAANRQYLGRVVCSAHK